MDLKGYITIAAATVMTITVLNPNKSTIQTHTK